jgi:hypothetical protein
VTAGWLGLRFGRVRAPGGRCRGAGRGVRLLVSLRPIRGMASGRLESWIGERGLCCHVAIGEELAAGEWWRGSRWCVRHLLLRLAACGAERMPPVRS